MKHESPTSTTAGINGRLWGARAIDWSQLQEPMFRPVYEAAFDRCRVGPGTRLLDVGCGSGLAVSMADQLGASVAGLDASDTLLRIARQRSHDGEFHEGDLESLPFDDHEFDVVTGFNAFQYAGNPIRALSEARRVAKPEGFVLIMTWGPPEHMEAASVVSALKPLLPPPPPDAPGPFALSDESRLRDFASSAGLTVDDIFDVDAPWTFQSLDLALRAMRSSGVSARAIALAGETAVDEAHAAALAPFARPDGRYRIGATFRCLIARA